MGGGGGGGDGAWRGSFPEATPVIVAVLLFPICLIRHYCL